MTFSAPPRSVLGSNVVETNMCFFVSVVVCDAIFSGLCTAFELTNGAGIGGGGTG